MTSRRTTGRTGVKRRSGPSARRWMNLIRQTLKPQSRPSAEDRSPYSSKDRSRATVSTFGSGRTKPEYAPTAKSASSSSQGTPHQAAGSLNLSSTSRRESAAGRDSHKHAGASDEKRTVAQRDA